MKKFDDVFKNIKNRAKKENVKKEELKEIYNSLQEINQIQADADKKIQEIKEKIYHNKIYALNSGLYCEFLQNLEN